MLGVRAYDPVFEGEEEALAVMAAATEHCISQVYTFMSYFRSWYVRTCRILCRCVHIFGFQVVYSVPRLRGRGGGARGLGGRHRALHLSGTYIRGSVRVFGIVHVFGVQILYSVLGVYGN